MAVNKYDGVHGERFIVLIRGLYLENKIRVDEFKDRNAGLMKNKWIETVSRDNGGKIYELYDPDGKGEIIKEALQEWLCDNRLEITQCINIALRNHERSFAEWFKYVDDLPGPDELALYSLSRKYGVHTSIYNKSYVWTTLMNHITRSDVEIYRLSGVNLVYLDEATYGIIREIRAPQIDITKPIPNPTRGRFSKRTKKTTCRDSSRGHKSDGSTNISKQSGSRGRKTQSLSESRCASYGITPPDDSTRSVRSTRRKIDYVSLNDGFDGEDSTPTPAKKRKKESFRPRSAPSATRLSAHKKMNTPEANELTAVPSTSKVTPSTRVPTPDMTLPDLVVTRPNAPLDITTPTATNTIEDLEAASTLLSLGDTLEDTLDANDDNALLMPIGGSNIPEDVAPQPLRLDQVSVDRVIAEIVDTEQSEIKDDRADGKDKNENVIAPLPTEEPDEESTAPKKGSLKTKTYVLKKKPSTKRLFKCSECKVVKPTVQELNNHHRRHHNPRMCKICNRTFALASSLARHMYEHDEKRFQCEKCEFSSHFASELETHKIVHRKTPTHKCMHVNCGRWFLRKWDLTLHLQTHDGQDHKCDYEDCKFSATTKKQLKEHQKTKHNDDYPYECKVCHKGFRYRSGLKRHRDKDHK